MLHAELIIQPMEASESEGLSAIHTQSTWGSGGGRLPGYLQSVWTGQLIPKVCNAEDLGSAIICNIAGRKGQATKYEGRGRSSLCLLGLHHPSCPKCCSCGCLCTNILQYIGLVCSLPATQHSLPPRCQAPPQQCHSVNTHKQAQRRRQHMQLVKENLTLPSRQPGQSSSLVRQIYLCRRRDSHT